MGGGRKARQPNDAASLVTAGGRTGLRALRLGSVWESPPAGRKSSISLGPFGKSYVPPSPSIPLHPPTTLRVTRAVFRTLGNCLQIWGHDDAAREGQLCGEATPGSLSLCVPSFTPFPSTVPTWVGPGEQSRHPGEAGPLMSHQGPHPGHAAMTGRSGFRCFHTLHSSHLSKGWSPAALQGPLCS